MPQAFVVQILVKNVQIYVKRLKTK